LNIPQTESTRTSSGPLTIDGGQSPKPDGYPPLLQPLRNSLLHFDEGSVLKFLECYPQLLLSITDISQCTVEIEDCLGLHAAILLGLHGEPAESLKPLGGMAAHFCLSFIPDDPRYTKLKKAPGFDRVPFLAPVGKL